MTGAPGRREVLAGMGVIGVAAGLAACGSGEGSGSGKATVAAADVPVGGGYVDKGAKVVVTQPRKGEYHAFAARCPHAGCLVNEVRDAKIVCPCHSSLFDATTGAVVGGPSPKGLDPLPVKVSGSDVVAGG